MVLKGVRGTCKRNETAHFIGGSLMQRVSRVFRLCLILTMALAASMTAAHAGTIAIGYVSWDLNFPGNTGEFDIINNTGPINGSNVDFPVEEVVTLSDLTLMVSFSDGS